MDPNNQNGPYRPQGQSPYPVPPSGNQPVQPTPIPQQVPLPRQPYQQYPPQPTPTPTGQYEFIMNPSQPAPKSPFGGSSLPIKIAVIGGGLLILIIVLVFLKSLLGPKSNTAALIGVANQQQALIHIMTEATGSDSSETQTFISSNHQNFAYTTQLSLTTAQKNLLTYLQNNGKKIKTKELNAVVTTDDDARLSAAAKASNYDSVFKEVAGDRLDQYMQSLNLAFDATKGVNGRQLLQTDFKQATLLKTQLDNAN